MSKHSVLVDLCLAHKKNGFSGIPQDNRILFASLSNSSQLDVTGWIYNDTLQYNSLNLNQIIDQSLFLGFALDGRDIKNLFSLYLTCFWRFLKFLRKIKAVTKINHKNYNLHDSLDFSQIWRSFFQNVISPDEFNILSRNKYAITDLSNHRKLFALIPPFFNSDQYDFVLSQDARFVKLSPNTISLIRYHDAVPIFSSDTVSNSRALNAHYKNIKKREKESIFICSSPSSLHDLNRLSPVAAERAHVIPCILPKMTRKETHYSNFIAIASSCISPATIGNNTSKELIERWMKLQSDTPTIPEFIMTLSTIEPRKNHLGLLASWQQLRLSSRKDIKLLIVGSPGWMFEPIIAAMKPFVSSGDLLHLEKVPQNQLPYLYSAATCFVFPSFAEGFGLPPCEAMQCECPVAVSDIPAHRYSAGDGALYFSPYDSDEMTEALHQLIFSDKDHSLRKKLIEKGLQNVKKFEKNTVLPQWEILFDELSANKKKLNQK